MTEQRSHMMGRVNETSDAGSHLTRFRRYRDERTGQYMLSVDGSPYSVPLIAVSEPRVTCPPDRVPSNSPTPHHPTPAPTSTKGTHEKQSCTASLIPVFSAGLQSRAGREDADEPGQFLEFAPTWAGMELKQTGVTTIGREPGTGLLINHPTVSRRHAQIACIGQRYLLHDLGSKNGTFVNDIRLEPDKVWALNPNDRIRFGKGMSYVFQVHPTR